MNETHAEGKYRLTAFAHSSGCGCKIEPALLHTILEHSRTSGDFPQLIVGNSSNDDAAVWDIGDGKAMINTVDFFMPIVDDAADFGRIAAANAISDVYAMGGKPVFANALLGWPVDKLPASLASAVMQGALAVCREAGIPLAGGHSIDNPEPLFGLSVSGLAETGHVKRNSTAQVGDLLFLTKPLGTGIMGTAVKRGKAGAGHLDETVRWMSTLNKAGYELGKLEAVHAMTDVTGFALLGHLIEMTSGSRVSAEIDMAAVPVLPFLDEYLSQNIIPDNTYRNWNSYEKKVQGVNDMRSFQLLNDPQTSGGLLVAAAPGALADIKHIFNGCGLSAFAQPIGRIIEKDSSAVYIR